MGAALDVIPVPREATVPGEPAILATSLAIEPARDDLVAAGNILAREIRAMVKGARVTGPPARGHVTISLDIDATLGQDEHRIVTGERITIEGGSPVAVMHGAATLLHLASPAGRGCISLPRVTIHDKPFAPYRGLLVDVARKKHRISTLRRLLLACRWYKLSHVQLHLTDDQSFTFPSSAHPALPTRGRAFTARDLRALVHDAAARGITILPELEVPGHARAMTRAMPGTFKLDGAVPNDSTINMGKERVYEVIDDLVGEMCDIFDTSPWIHLGADEVRFDGIDTDPDCIEYMKVHDLDSPVELYRHFITRINDIVKAHGKTLCIWEGFGPAGKVDIPRDIIVYEFECHYHLPGPLAAAGYTMVNASWKPLYITRKRHWTPEAIHAWNMFRWENHAALSVATRNPIQLDAGAPVLGAQVCSWSQPDRAEVPTIRRRIAALAERTWSVDATTATDWPSEASTAEFSRRLDASDAKLGKLLARFRFDR